MTPTDTPPAPSLYRVTVSRDVYVLAADTAEALAHVGACDIADGAALEVHASTRVPESHRDAPLHAAGDAATVLRDAVATITGKSPPSVADYLATVNRTRPRRG